MKTKDEIIYEMFLEIFPRVKRRRIVSIMSNVGPVLKTKNDLHIKESLESGLEMSELHQSTKDVKELYDTFGKHLSQEYILKIWTTAQKQRWVDKKEYHKMPKPDGRDNKALRVGSSGSNRNKVRFPKKVRGKATWKKFYTLFPQFEGYTSMDEYVKAVNEKYKQKALLDLAKEKELDYE